MTNFRNAVALVTGGNKGLGLEIARQLGQQGVRVVIGARDFAKGQAAASRLQSDGIDAQAVRLDVAETTDVTDLPAFFEELGRLDILINNAGVSIELDSDNWLVSTAGTVSIDKLRGTFETNLFGAVRMCREVVGEVTLINDAYNANPRSMEAAVIEMGARPAAGRRIAVIGDMLELGEQTERCHRELGRKLGNARLDVVWAVGPNARLIAEEARAGGMSSVACVHHETVEEALASFPVEPRPGDTWLFKASRGMALERLHDAVRARVGDAPVQVAEPAMGAAAAELPPHA